MMFFSWLYFKLFKNGIAAVVYAFNELLVFDGFKRLSTADVRLQITIAIL